MTFDPCPGLEPAACESSSHSAQRAGQVFAIPPFLFRRTHAMTSTARWLAQSARAERGPVIRARATSHYDGSIAMRASSFAYGPALPFRPGRLALDQTPTSPEAHNAAIIGRVTAILAQHLPPEVLGAVAARLHRLPSHPHLKTSKVAHDDPPPSGRVPTPPPARDPQLARSRQTQVTQGTLPSEPQYSNGDPNSPEGVNAALDLDPNMEFAADAATMFPDADRLISTDHGGKSQFLRRR